MMLKIKNFLFRGWLIESILVIILTLSFTLFTTIATDNFYVKAFASKFFTPTPQTPAKLKLTETITNGSTNSNQPSSTPGQSQSPGNSSPSTPPTTTNSVPPSVPAGTPTPTPTPTPIPTPTPTPTPTPQPSGCFVIVSGSLYNMQSIVGVRVTDITSGKGHTHSTSSFQCGSFSNPTDMTSTYISIHRGLGCWQRIAPYIVTPPAPTDPAC